MDSCLLIYAKDGKIKALNVDNNSKQKEDELIKDGWVHTQTLQVCAFIEYLHNNCEEVDLYNEINSLSKKVKYDSRSTTSKKVLGG